MNEPWHEKDFSIIIPCFNEAKVLYDCLDRFYRVKQEFNCEILVVDNRNKGISWWGLNNSWVMTSFNHELIDRVGVFSHNVGCGRGWQAGACMARGKVLIFTDAGLRFTNDDGVVPSFRSLYEHALDPKAGMVGFGGGYREVSEAKLSILPRYVGGPLVVDEISGFFWATRFEVFNEVGLDLRFSPAGHEETDYAFSVRKAGYDCVRLPRPPEMVHHADCSARRRQISWLGLTEWTRPDIDERNKKLFAEKWYGFPSVTRGNDG